METVLSYRGRVVTGEDLAFIRELIAGNPNSSRRELSRKLCQAWGLVQANGTPREGVCRGLMLALHRAGHIELPQVRRVAPSPLTRRRPPAPVDIDQTPVRASLRHLGPLTFRQVRRTSEEPLLNSLIQAYHYLGYTQPVGEHLKYLVLAGERPVACFLWGSAPRHLGPRDRFIGWSAEVRRMSIHLVAYNSRYLILPWVEVRYLASHLLGRMVRMLPGEWERVYGHPVYFAETFVDPTRFAGTCYRAANWVLLGQTTGRGKDDHTNRPNRPLKQVLGYPLTSRFRELLGGGAGAHPVANPAATLRKGGTPMPTDGGTRTEPYAPAAPEERRDSRKRGTSRPSERGAETSRTCFSPEERRLHSRLRQLLAEPGLLRGSLVEMRRSCGKKTCHCQRGPEHHHRGLYLSLSSQGHQRTIYVPAQWEDRVRQWVSRYRELRELLEQLSSLTLQRLVARER